MREIRIRKRADRRWSWVAGIVVMIAASVLLISGVGHVLALRESGREIGSIGELERYLSIESEEYEPGGKYVLTADLDVTGREITIGDNVEPFVGELDGAGHEIKGLSRPLFGKIGQGAKIENLVVEGTIREGELYGAGEGYTEGYGLLAAHIEGAEIRNVGAVGEIEIGDRVEREVRVRKGNEEGISNNEEGKGNNEEPGKPETGSNEEGVTEPKPEENGENVNNEEGKGNNEELSKPETEGNGEDVNKEEGTDKKEEGITNKEEPNRPEQEGNGEGTNKKEEGITNKEELSKPEPEGNQPEQGSNREELSKPEGTGAEEKPEEPAVGEPEAVVDPVAKLFGPVKAMAAEADIVSPEEDTSETGEGTNVPDTTPTTPDTGAVPQPGEPAEGEGTGTPDVPEVSQPEGPTEGPATDPTVPDVPTEPEAPVDPAPDQKEDTTQPEETAGDEYIRTTAEEVYAGGLIGVSEGESLIQNCYAFVKITKKGNETAAAAGGFIGALKEGGRIENSYATGSVEGAAVLGGFAGINEGGIGACYVSNTLGAGEERGAFVGRYGESASAKECAYDYRMSCGEDKQAQRKGTEELTGIQDSLSGEWHYTEGAYPQLPYFALNEKTEIQKKSKASAIALRLGSGTIEGVEGEIELIQEIEGEAVEWSVSGDISLTEEGKAVLKSSAEEEGTSAPEEGIVYSGVLRAVLGTEEKVFSVSTEKVLIKDETTVIEIYSLEDWNNFFDNIVSTTVLNQNIEIMNDLDFSGLGKSACSNVNVSYRGIVEGNGYQITGLRVPLFESLEDATIQNLTISGTVSSSSDHVGLLARRVVPGASDMYTEIINCHAEGTVKYLGSTDTCYTGGMIGFIESTVDGDGVIIKNCSANVDVSGYFCIGGFVGKGDRITFEDCQSYGSVYSPVGSKKPSVGKAGGIAGDLSNSNLSRCKIDIPYMEGRLDIGGVAGYALNCALDEVTGSAVIEILTDTSLGGNNIGGILGTGKGITISNSNFTGKIHVNFGDLYKRAFNIGGLCGTVSGDFYMDNCFTNNCVLEVDSDAGGLIGRIDQGSGSILNCYVENVYITGLNDIGGLIGAGTLKNGTIRNCFTSGVDLAAGGGSIGGFAGILTLNNSEIDSCYSSGRIKRGDQTGGFIGEISGNEEAIIRNCYTDVSVNSIQAGQSSGFIFVFWTVGSYVRFENCLANGALIRGNTVSNPSTNGFIRWSRNSEKNCYYNEELTGITDSDDTDDIIGISTANLLSGTPIQGFEDESVWLWEAGRYPQLTVFAKSDQENIRKQSEVSSIPAVYFTNENTPAAVSDELLFNTQINGTWEIEDNVLYIDNNKLKIDESLSGQERDVNLDFITESGYKKLMILHVDAPLIIRSLEDWDRYLGTGATEESLKQNYKLQFENQTCDFSNLQGDGVFKGKLYGNNQTITGLSRPLFLSGEDVAVIDLNLEGNITGSGWAGLLFGKVYFKSSYNGDKLLQVIKNCHASGSVSCNTNLSTYDTDGAGGLIGYVRNEAYDKGLIINCSSNVNVSGTKNVGGLIGYLYAYSSSVKVKDCYSTGKVWGQTAVGGLIGNTYNFALPDEDRGITNCFAMTDVEGIEAVGGLLGQIRYSRAVDCYASGTVMGNSKTGGLFGSVGTYGGAFKNCYSSVTVSGKEYTGSVIGFSSSDTYENCYYDKQMAGVLNSSGNNSEVVDLTGISGYSTQSMTGENAKGMGLDEKYWSFSVGHYPQLNIFDGRTPSDLSSIAIYLTEGETVIDPVGAIQIDSAAGNWSSAPDDAFTVNGSTVTCNNKYEKALLSCSFDGFSRSFLFGSSSGEDIVYTIYSIEDWNRYLGIGATPRTLSANYQLAEGGNYDFSSLTIGTGTEYGGFTGTLDGKNQTITGLQVPLFNVLENATINDLNVEGNLIIAKGERTGLLASMMAGGEVNNCHAKGEITCEDDVWGYNPKGTGGLIGVSIGTTNVRNKVLYCSANVDIVLEENAAIYGTGGLIGKCDYTNISYSYASGNWLGYYETGGLIGNCSNSTITQCFSNGSVEVRNSTPYAGGLIGNLSSSTITNCYSTAAVAALNRAGGLIGNAESACTISGCFAAGTIKEATNNPNSNTVGGLIGKAAGTTLTNCYYDLQMTGMEQVSAGLKALSTEEMCQASIGGITTNSTVWERTAGYYPQLKYFKNKNVKASEISSIPLKFANSGAKASRVEGDIDLSAGEFAGWSFEPETQITVNELQKTATPIWSGELVVRYKQSGFEKRFLLTLKAGNRIIRNLADWNYYLGPDASEESLGGDYQLSADGDFDFSTVEQSSGVFTGELEGNGQKIYGLKIPLFKEISGAVFRNLNLEGKIEGTQQYTGILAGRDINEGTELKNCHVEGEVNTSFPEDSNYYMGTVGGFIGYTVKASFMNCSAQVKLTASENPGGSAYIGGLAGYGDSIEAADCDVKSTIINMDDSRCIGGMFGKVIGTITNCTSNSDIQSKSGAGGLIGEVSYSSTATTRITGCSFDGAISAVSCAGGLIGYASNSLTIDQCSGTGSIQGGTSVGGFIGYASYSTNVSNGYFVGKIKGRSEVGGLVGRANNTINITNCFSSGMVEGTQYVGGLLGFGGSSSGKILRCYAGNTVYGVDTVGGIAGRTYNVVENVFSTSVVRAETNKGALIGFQSPAATTNSCFDLQMAGCTNAVGNATVGASVTGKLTSELTGTSISGMSWITSNSSWTCSEGLYPRLTTFAASEEALVSAVPLLLAVNADGTYDSAGNLTQASVALPSAAGGQNLTWKLDGEPADSSVQLILREQFLTVSINGGTREKIFLLVNSNSHTIPLKNLEDWEKYLGKNADPEYLSWDYTLDFPGESCDFSGLTASVGTSKAPFTGSLEGNNKRITGLTKPLFLYMNDASVSNLILAGDISEFSSNYVGMLAGTIAGESGTSIVNCHVFGSISVEGTDYIGGIAGYVKSVPGKSDRIHIFRNCSVNAELTGQKYIGGIAGYAQCTSFEACYASSAITADTYTGQIVGRAYGSTMKNCYGSGNISGNLSGGLAGDLYNGIMKDCYSSVQLLSKSEAGGLLGSVTGEDNTIDHCYYDMQLSGTDIGIGTGTISETIKITGMGTDELINQSAALFTAESQNYWLDNASQYPQLKQIAESAVPEVKIASEVSSYTILLKNGESSRLSRSGFEYKEGLFNCSQDQQTFLLNNGSGTVSDSIKGGKVQTTLYLEKGGFKKAISLTVVGTPIQIRSLTDWETYFGTGADPENQGKVYELNFAGAKENFENLSATTGTNDEPFCGIIYGNNNVIYNLDKPLFGVVDGMIINDLTLKGDIASDSKRIGLLVDNAKTVAGDITLNNCHVYGTIEATGTNVYAGGFIGAALTGTYNIVLNECSSAVKMSGSLLAGGGFIGRALSVNVDNCFTNVEIKTTNTSVNGDGGGFIGTCGILAVCNSYTSGSLCDFTSMGGFAGQVEEEFTAENSYSAVSEQGAARAGGLIGEVNGSYTISSSYFDSQLSGGTAAIGGLTDENSWGKATNEITSSAMAGNLGSNCWYYEDYSYPQLKVMKSSASELVRNASAVSSAALFLKDKENSQQVQSPMTYCTTEGTWCSQIPEAVKIVNDQIIPMRSNRINITYSSQGLTKTIAIRVIDNSLATSIRSLDDWERYLGREATADDLNGIYQLDFTGDECDFSTLEVSVGLTSDKPFTGMLFGNNQTITGLKKPLFQYISGATLSDIIVKNGEIRLNTTEEHVGMLVGTIISGKSSCVESCHVSGIVENGVKTSYYSTDLGGMIGRAEGGEGNPTIISNCSADVEVTGMRSNKAGKGGLLVGFTNWTNISQCHVIGRLAGNLESNGGICGYFRNGTITGCSADVVLKDCRQTGGIAGAAVDDCKIIDCHVEGSISGDNYLGGIVGYRSGVVSSFQIENCYMQGNIEASNVSGAGGILGYGAAQFKNCYFNGDIYAVFGSVGGLCGYAGMNLSAENCYAVGNLQVEYPGYGIGGLIGNTSYSFTMTRCYFAGLVEKYYEKPDQQTAGGLIGNSSKSNNMSYMTDCYFDKQLSGVALAVGNKKSEDTTALGLNTSELTDTPSGFTTENGWFLRKGYYPQLTVFAGSDVAHLIEQSAVSAVAVYLPEGSKANCFTGSEFTYDNTLPGTWKERSNYITFASGTANFQESLKSNQELRIVYEENNLEKSFVLRLAQDEITVISSLEDWEHYLGSGATPQTLLYNYRLDFTDNTCDFSELKQSSGIVNSSGGKYFAGALDGNNQSITGLRIPLFDDTLSGAEIKDLKIVGTVTGRGMLGNTLTGAKITNCHVRGSVSGMGNVGGLSGYLGSCTVTECSSMVEVHGTISAGGFAGRINTGKIEKCMAGGNVQGEDSTGGFAGITNSGTYTNCYSTGSVTANGEYAGGFVGTALSNLNGKSCYASGNIINLSGNSGGFAGKGQSSVTTFIYDQQISGVELFSSNLEKRTGKGTADMTGSGITLSGFSDNEEWVLTDGYYPQLAVFANSIDEYVKNMSSVSTAAVIIASGETGCSVQTPLTFSPNLSGVWRGDPDRSLDIDPDEHRITLLADDIVRVIYGLDGVEKSFLFSKGALRDTIIIHNLDEWEQYLGTGADALSLSRNYRLDFGEENSCDFSGLNTSVGYGSDTTFTGTLDGNNQTIYGLDIPLFYILRGSIKDLTLIGNISSDQYEAMGMLAGVARGMMNKELIIENCHVQGKIAQVALDDQSKESFTGGLLGKIDNVDVSSANYPAVYVKGCSAEAVVEGQNYVGGLVGNSRKGKIENCSAEGSISANYSVGGLIGYTLYTNIDNSFSDVEIEANSNAGGLIGQSSNALVVNQSFSLGNITAQSATGGFIGSASSGIEVSDCYSTGNISTEPGATKGGFICTLYGGSSYTSIIKNCYMSGQLRNSNNTGNQGSFVGSLSSPGYITFENCYFDIQRSGITKPSANMAVITGIYGKTTAEMVNNPLDGLTADHGWVMEAGLYPRLGAAADSPEVVTAAIPIYAYCNSSKTTIFDSLYGITDDFSVPVNILGKPVSWSSSDVTTLVINPSGEAAFKGKGTETTLTLTYQGVSRDLFIRLIKPMESWEKANVTLPIVDSVSAEFSKVLIGNINARTVSSIDVSSVNSAFEEAAAYQAEQTDTITANYSTYGTVNANAKLGFALETSSGTEVDLSQAVTTPITGVTGIKLYNAAAYNCAEDKYFRIILEVPDDRSVAINVTIPGITSKKLDITVPTPTQISLQPGIRSKSYTDEWEIKNDTAYPLAVTLASVVPGSVPGEEGTLGLVDPSIPIRPGEELITQGVKLGLAYTEENEGESVEKGIYYNPAEGAEQPVLGLGAGRIQKFKYFLEYSPYYTGTQRTFNYQLKYETKIPEYDIVPGNLEVKDAPAGTETPPAE
ncbi:GLUG motif-containing protein [Anaerolentibacter hominis]|uniref:GLUG motif-containing protein n=1 Tax=Anaerolentibacter hominis TaxID=3079009 RepID=UPI0031B82AF9